jgi:hypothetical protein
MAPSLNGQNGRPSLNGQNGRPSLNGQNGSGRTALVPERAAARQKCLAHRGNEAHRHLTVKTVSRHSTVKTVGRHLTGKTVLGGQRLCQKGQRPDRNVWPTEVRSFTVT